MRRVCKAVIYKVLMLMQFQSVEAQLEGPGDFEKRKLIAIAELNNHPGPDTARVNALLQVLNTAIFLKEKKDLLGYLPEAMKLSTELGYYPGLAGCYLQKASYYKSASDYSRALACYDSALAFADKTTGENMRKVKQVALQQKGAIFHAQENYYPAIDFYFEAAKYLVPGDVKREVRINAFITEIYSQLNNFEKAEEFATKNIVLIKKDRDTSNLMTVYLSYIEVCLAKNDLNNALLYLNKMDPFVPDENQVQVTFGYYLKHGRVCFMKQEYAKAYEYFKKANIYALTGGHATSKSISLYYLARTALKLGYDEQAKNFTLENLQLASTMNTKWARIDALANLSDYYKKNGNSNKAYDLLQQSMLLKDSFNQENNIKQLNVLGVMYNYGKQQEQISRLETEKEKQVDSVKQKSLLNNVFIASIIVLLFIGYLGYTNFRKGQQLSSAGAGTPAAENNRAGKRQPTGNR